MNNQISREDLKDKIDSGADFDLIEVLKPEQYEKMHLPGAINVSVADSSFEEKIQKVVRDKGRTVVVYCWDTDCDASEKAQKKMQEMGYTNVLDYAEGKKDWKDAGYEVEGSAEAA